MKPHYTSLIALGTLVIVGAISTLDQPTLVSAAVQQALQLTATGTASPLPTQAATTQVDKSGPQDKGVVSIGSTVISQQASPTTACLPASKTHFVEGRIGVVTGVDGSQWTVPSEVNNGPVAVDLYNDCTGTGDNSKQYLSQLKTVIVDPDGVDVTAFLFANNYFEMYVNGVMVGRDSITFVPFNSSVVRFKVKYPYTVAFRLVDWEEHLGIGMEYANYQIGHSGFVAKFSDGTVSSNQWKLEPFYFAPLDNPNCVDLTKNRDTSSCMLQPTCMHNNPDKTCKALHFYTPVNWTAPSYDDAWWQTPTLYKPLDVTHLNEPGYTNYASYFTGADFIWSHSNYLDNLVLARYTVEKPTR